MMRRMGWVFLAVLAVLAVARADTATGPEPLPQEGYDHPRGDGVVNIRLVDNRFEIHFLNADRIPQPVAYDQAVVYFEQISNRKNEGNVPLSASPDGLKLVAARPVRPPPLYFARVVFLRNGEIVESIARFSLR